MTGHIIVTNRVETTTQVLYQSACIECPWRGPYHADQRATIRDYVAHATATKSGGA